MPHDYWLTEEERKSSIGCVAKSELNISANSWKHRLRKGWADHNYFDRSCIWLEDCIHRFKIDTQFIFASAEYLKHRSEGRCWPRKLDIMEKTSSTWEPARWKTQERHPEVTWARKLMWTSRRSRATRLLHVHAWDVLVKKLRKELHMHGRRQFLCNVRYVLARVMARIFYYHLSQTDICVLVWHRLVTCG